MASKVKIDEAELQKHLVEQRDFLETSAAAFDAGQLNEAKRLAVTVRVLVHDTKQSTSLLTQLGMKDDRKWISTASAPHPGSVIAHGGLVWVAHGANGPRYFAMLDKAEPLTPLTFEDWWNELVFQDRSNNSFSRRDVVLTLANQDGGGHVDPAIGAAYSNLKKDSIGLVAHGPNSQQLMTGAELVTMRQIAHEVLKTLDPTYAREPDMTGVRMVTGNVHFGGTNIAGWTVEFGASESGSVRTLPTTQPRNAQCACGSGKKYKHCHGKLA